MAARYNAKYPWNRWLNRKQKLTLRRGVDYHCQPHSMAVMIRNAAAVRGVRVSVYLDEGTITVRRVA